jgi:uncharacterized membrane protein/predicted flap endonuclease-1-like 5' DNA nuclease
MARRQTLVAITVDDRDSARKLLGDLREYDRNSTDMSILDAVYATKDDKGNFHIHQTNDLEGGQGAMGGGIVGLIAGGLVFGPLGAAIGTALGGVLAGVYASLRDSGMNNRVMKNIVREMQTNQTTLIILYEGVMHPSMNSVFAAHDAQLFYTNLPIGAEDSIRAILNSPSGTQAVAELNNYEVNERDLDSAYKNSTPVYVVDEEDQVIREKTPVEDVPVVPVMPVMGAMSSGLVAPAVVPAMAEITAPTVKEVEVREEKEPTVVRLKSDDLTRISGITSEIELVLRDNNFKTYVQLSHASTNEIRTLLDKANIEQPTNISTWTEQAWLAAQGKFDELNDLQASLKPYSA